MWIGRSQTGRSVQQPLGNDTEYVRKSNQLSSRVVLLIMVGILVSNVRMLTEQPASSIMEHHPRWTTLANMFGTAFHTVRVWMKPYGAGSPKPTLLYGTMEEAERLFVPLDPQEPNTVHPTSVTEDRFGRRMVSGADDLKRTQAYPPEFGLAVAKTFFNNIVPDGYGSPLDKLVHNVAVSNDMWHDADLRTVANDLCIRPHVSPVAQILCTMYMCVY